MARSCRSSATRTFISGEAPTSASYILQKKKTIPLQAPSPSFLINRSPIRSGMTAFRQHVGQSVIAISPSLPSVRHCHQPVIAISPSLPSARHCHQPVIAIGPSLPSVRHCRHCRLDRQSLFVHHAVAELSELSAVPSAGRSHEVSCDSLQLVNLLASAVRTFLHVLLGVLISAVHAAVAVVVH